MISGKKIFQNFRIELGYKRYNNGITGRILLVHSCYRKTTKLKVRNGLEWSLFNLQNTAPFRSLRDKNQSLHIPLKHLGVCFASLVTEQSINEK